MQFVRIRVGAFQLGLESDRVERVLPAFALAPAPRGPDILLGVAELAGDFLAAVDLRHRLEGSRTPIHPGLAYVVARAGGRRLILVADEVPGLAEGDPSAFVPAAAVAPGLGPVKGLLRDADGGLWIQDLDAFLSWDEGSALDAAVGAAGGSPPPGTDGASASDGAPA